MSTACGSVASDRQVAFDRVQTAVCLIGHGFLADVRAGVAGRVPVTDNGTGPSARHPEIPGCPNGFFRGMAKLGFTVRKQLIFSRQQKNPGP